MTVRGLAGAALALALVLAPAAAAVAEDPVTLGSSHVLDEAGALSSAEVADAEARIAELESDTDLDLWVVFVDDFENPSDAEEWANTVADDNGLGPSQYLLAVAVEGRNFYLSGSSEGPVSFTQLGDIEAERIQPELVDEDWAGAVDAAASGLTAAVGGGGGGGAVGTVVVVVAVVAILGVIVFFVVRAARRRKAAPAGPARVPLADLERQAASALVATDDAVKTSDQELSFARAQFGDAATTEFAAALADAKAKLDQAFGLKQRLDDAEPDGDDQKRSWNEQIVALCTAANQGLDEKAQAFDELRKLEQNAPEALARIEQQRTSATSALDAAAARLAELRAHYSPAALSAVADNPEQARGRLSFAQAQLAEAQQAIAAGDGGRAAVGLRAAEEAVAQAATLQKAVSATGDDLAKAETDATALLGDLEQDVATASALPDADGSVAAAIGATREQIAAGRAGLAAGQRDPLATLQALEAANTRIDGVVAGVREAAAQAERAARQLTQTITQAQAQVSAAEDYITTRRGAVGTEARTRLANAGAALVEARQLQASDPGGALQAAQRAAQLAAAAMQLAQNDVSAYDGAGWGDGGYGSGGRGGNGSFLDGMLGGILVNSLSGGGGSSYRRSSSSGGFGSIFGSSGGGRSGGFGGGFSSSRSRSGGFSSGSFGGGGTRARRGGGRF